LFKNNSLYTLPKVVFKVLVKKTGVAFLKEQKVKSEKEMLKICEGLRTVLTKYVEKEN
jgi:predicted SprT family Zn-dependent metalloprotease